MKPNTAARVVLTCMAVLLEVDGEDLRRSTSDADTFERDHRPLDLILEDGGFSEYFENRMQSKSVDGEPLYQSDMRLTEEQRSDRQAKDNTWTNRAIKYTITAESQPDKSHIIEAIRQWDQDTCLDFQEKDASFTGEVHLRFVKKSTECSSPVGMVPYMIDGMDVRIGEGCATKGVIMHEIGHAIGLKHQQSRSDRDSYVRINMQNVRDGMQHNFDIDPTAHNFSVPYDLTSLMHYGPHYFSANGRPTIEARQIHLTGLMGNKNGLSHRDKQLANAMYQCNSACPAASAPQCQNGGFVDKSCACVCPPGISGTVCDDVPPNYSYYEVCGNQQVTSEGQITSLNWPAVYPPGKTCFWVINAPDGKSVQITFDNFHMLYRYQGTGKCEFDKIEVYLDEDGTADKDYCDQEGKGVVLTSSGTRLVVSMKSYKHGTYPSMQKGFTATVKFV